MIQELSQQKLPLESVSATDPIVLCASDDNYVKPLAVTLLSAVNALRDGSQLHVLLMDGGISESNWTGLRETLFDLPITVHVLRPDRQEIADLGISHHITHTAYFRLLAARLLPDSIKKVIYLDSDVLVKDDLTELWNAELGNHYCLAAVDIACPYVDAYAARSTLAPEQRTRLNKAIPHLAAIAPVPNWKALELDGAEPYFNSGVMVLNLARWRAESIDKRLLACLRDNRNFVWCWDQYALNVVFAGQWGKLPARWNQGAHVYEYPDEGSSPIDEAEFIAMRDDPALIHFTTEFKPWDFQPCHPLRDRFYDFLDQTAWSGWRPAKPDFDLKRAWDLTAAHWIRKWVVQYRKFRSMFA
ncbi:MAG: lipopolysaccharide biosynthesis glycosyltransferase [Mariniblastus sp.]